MVSSYCLISDSFVQNSMYRGAMEPSWLIGGVPGGAGWAVRGKGAIARAGSALYAKGTLKYSSPLE